MPKPSSRPLKATRPRSASTIDPLEPFSWLLRYSLSLQGLGASSPKSGKALRHTPGKLLEEFSSHPANPCLAPDEIHDWPRKLILHPTLGKPAPITRDGYFQLFSLFAERGALLDRVDSAGRSALHSAAYLANTSAALALIDCGASISIRDASGDTALHDAAGSGSLECSMALIGRGAQLSWINAQGLHCWETSIALRHPELAASLLALAEKELLESQHPANFQRANGSARL